MNSGLTATVTKNNDGTYTGTVATPTDLNHHTKKETTPGPIITGTRHTDGTWTVTTITLQNITTQANWMLPTPTFTPPALTALNQALTALE